MIEGGREGETDEGGVHLLIRSPNAAARVGPG